MESLRKVGSITFPTDRRCKYVGKMVNLPDGRLSILGRSQEAIFPDTIYCYDKTSSTISGVIQEGVYPATYMTVNSSRELVVARREKPAIRIFHPDTGAYRDINITHDGMVIDQLWTVETDADDNMFIMSAEPHRLLVLNPLGKVIKSVPLRGWANMIYSDATKILNIICSDMLLRIDWGNKTLDKIASPPHRIKGFHFHDICIGRHGEVIVVGRKESKDIKVYQVEHKVCDDREEFVWRPIKFQDNIERKSAYHLSLCSENDKLWLGYGDDLEVFQMMS